MRKLCKVSILILTAILFTFQLSAQRNFFTDAGANARVSTNGLKVISPNQYRSASLDLNGLKSFLATAPAERNLNRNSAPVLTLPMPDGSFARFKVWESPVMEAGLAAKYPDIKTYAGQGIDDPTATIRFDVNPHTGFHAQILSPNGRVFIDPYANGDLGNYMSYRTSDLGWRESVPCLIPEEEMRTFDNIVNAGPCRGTQLATYRLALACTGEYATRVCLPAAPTVPATLAAMVTSVNRVTGVYESEISVRLLLIANNDQIIYLDGATDPYTNNNGFTMLPENQTNLDAIIGTANYDVGHVFSTGGGGVATLNSPCNPATKARGVTGLPNPIGDAFDIDYVAHEMGHQFGAPHTFNSVTSNCSGNRSSTNAYEPGSGTTIMGYAGICGSDNIQPNSDPFFHTISFDRISTFISTSGTCHGSIATGNTLPVITAMNNNNANIPLNTPFTLTGAATDANGDALTYCWEQWDLGPAGAWNAGANNNSSPLFRSRAPKTSGSRTFPDMSVILANYPANPPSAMNGLKGETLPLVARTMKFRLTVRDNRAGGGGVVTGGDGCSAGFEGMFQVNVIDATGPFVVTVPNGGESYVGGSTQTVTWNVAGTNAAPINTTNVRITLSTDGGLTYPTVLLASTANDGSENVVLPSTPTNNARVRIEAVGNIYFDISNNDFIITAPPTGFEFDSPGPATVACGGPATSSVTLNTTSVGGFSTAINLTATGNPAGTTVSFSPATINPGSSTTVTLNSVNTLAAGSYTVTVTGTAGSTIRNRVITFNVSPGSGPAITGQPGNQVACVGDNASFTVVAPGALSYLWQVSTNGGGTFSDIPSSNNATLTLTSVTAGMNNNLYRVIITGQCGTSTSNNASLTVNTLPAVNTQPQSQTLCVNSNVTFSVGATGTGISYQWQVSTDNGANYTDIPSANSSTYTINGITTSQSGNRYRVVISGTCPPNATSNGAVLTVITPVTVTDQPDNVTICETGNVVFTVAGSGSNVQYQWQVSTNGGGSYTDIPGANSATLNVNNVSASMNNNMYRALLWNPTCTTPVASTGATLIVNARPTVTLTASPYTRLLPGLTTTLTANIFPSAAGFNVTWYRNNLAITNPGLTRVVDVTQLGSYRVDIVNATTGCNNQSNVVLISDSSSTRLFIYPSPNNGQFTVAYYNSSGGITSQSVTVYNSAGARVYNAKLPVTSPYQLHAIDMRTAARGIYYVVVGDANGKKIADGKVLIH